jgi:hypothetical protein
MLFKFLKKAKYFTITILGIWAVTACVDLYDAGLNTNIKKLVVDGEITNLPGPYRVTLQQSSPFGTKDFSPPPFNAVVSIVDNLGNAETLTDLGFGVFETVKTQGVVGRSYTLKIKIGDKKVYTSTPQTIKAPIKVDKVYSEFEPYKEGSGTYIGGDFNVYLDTQDPAASGDYYRWNYTNYEPIEFCEQTRFKNDGGDFAIRQPCCAPCWEINKCLGCIYLGSDQFANGKKINKQYIAKFPYNSISPVFIQIEQKSLSKENYFYWKEIDSQINNSGGIFDTPPATVQGNVTNTTDPKEQVLGFFAASGVSLTPFRVIRQVPNKQPVIIGKVEWTLNPVCVSCVESLYRTAKKPAGF